MKALRAEHTNAYYAFLLLTTPNVYSWELNSGNTRSTKWQNSADNVGDGGLNYVELVCKIAFRQHENAILAQQSMTPSERFEHERRPQPQLPTVPAISSLKVEGKSLDEAIRNLSFSELRSAHLSNISELSCPV